MGKIEELKRLGYTVLSKIMNDNGHKTVSGKPFTPVNVNRILNSY